MLLEELSRNKKAMAGFIIVALCIIYIISNKFLFRTILGRLLLVIGLVATTNYNKTMGLGLLIVICLAYSQMSTDFENMQNPPSKTTPNPSSTSKPTSVLNPTTSKPTSNTTSTSNTTLNTTSNTTSTPNTTTPDIATIEEKKRNITTGKKVSSLPIPPKDSAKDVSGTTNVKESFLNYSQY
jgi:cytoskeletal protein RodZ